jgi:hypothetical protein
MTVKLINAAIKHLNLEIIKGSGYVYFLDLTTGYQVGDSVHIAYLNHVSLDRWIEEAEGARKDEEVKKF